MMSAVEHNPHWMKVTFEDGEAWDYPTVWLRDNIPTGRHRNEGQRLFDINLLPADLAISEAVLNNGGVQVAFSDGTTDLFPATFLRAHPLAGSHEGEVTPPPSLWGSERQELLEFADYQRLVSDDQARAEWLRHLRDSGYALVENTPAEEGTVTRVVGLFGFVRETNYGTLFDVVVRPDPANLANTSARIGMHTDNPYRDPVPGLQLLHCIVNESDGGESQLCDGFAVAERLRQEDENAFRLLSTHPVRFRYLDDGNSDLQCYRPLIETNSRGHVTGVRYNSRSASAFDMEASLLPDYYRAYRKLSELLNAPESRIEFRLGPGQLMIFDNQRVLHGRSEYKIGHRHLQGCYADKDALHSTIRVLESA